MSKAKVYYFDAAYHAGQWTRAWYPTKADARKARKEALRTFDWKAPYTDEAVGEGCGEYGDVDPIYPVEVELTKVGVLEFLGTWGDANGD